MGKNFKEKLKTIGHSLICVGLGLAIGFHILPYYFSNKWMDVSLETGIEVGRYSVHRELKRGFCIVQENQVLFYPDSTYYIILKKGN